MSRVTVVGTATAVPGHARDIGRAMADQFKRTGPTVPGRIDAHLFEDAAEPSVLVYIGRWANRGAFEDYYRGHRQIGDRGWYAEMPATRIYTPLKTYAELYAGGEGAGLGIVDGPAAADDLRALLISLSHAVHPPDIGLIEYEIGEDLDRPGHFIFFTRWRSLRDLDTIRRTVVPAFVERARALGATIRQLTGPLRAETPWETPS